MTQDNTKKALLGRAALLLTSLIWGSSFFILKNTLESVSTLYVLAIRFSGAAVLLCLFGLRELKKLDRNYLRGGAIMGVCLFAAYVLQTYGLTLTTPGKNAFLTATYCVIAPLLAWLLLRRKPSAYNILAAVVCIVGIGFVSLNDDFSVNLGDGLTICCGLFYALHILATDRYAEGRSALLLTMLQFAVAGVLAWLGALLTEPLPKQVPADAALSIVYLCVMCSALCNFLQTYGQKYTSASGTAILMTLESVFGAAFSALFYHERFSLKLLFGFALIFLAVLISETKLSFLRREKPKE